MSQSAGSNTDREDSLSPNEEEEEEQLRQALEQWGLSEEDAEAAAHLARIYDEAKKDNNPIADAIDP